jgi:hypothetical protein
MLGEHPLTLLVFDDEEDRQAWLRLTLPARIRM